MTKNKRGSSQQVVRLKLQSQVVSGISGCITAESFGMLYVDQNLWPLLWLAVAGLVVGTMVGIGIGRWLYRKEDGREKQVLFEWKNWLMIFKASLVGPFLSSALIGIGVIILNSGFHPLGYVFALGAAALISLVIGAIFTLWPFVSRIND